MSRTTNDESRTTKAGFTLLEALLSIALFTFGIIALIAALNAGMFSATDVESTNLASNIGQARMEEIKGTVFSSIASVSAAPDPNFPQFAVTTTVTTINANLKQIDVIVAWTTTGGQTNIRLTTLRAAS